MNIQWKTIRIGFLLFTLPLVATAAASAHSWMIDSSPISIDSSIPVVVSSAIGNARVHTVAINRNGAVEGKIASINPETKETKGLSGLKIFFIQDGKVVKESVTLADGSFLVQGIAEGDYSFVATGKSGFAAYGVKIVTDENGEYVNIMEAAAVSPRFDLIRRILKQELPQEVASEILESSGELEETQVAGSNRVLLEDGVLSGRVVALNRGSKSVNGTAIHILQNDTQVAEVQADESGSFSVEGLEPGVYDFVAAGPSGFAAVRFEAVSGDEALDVLTSVGSEEDFELADSDLPASGPVYFGESGSVEPSALAASLLIRLTATQDNQVVGDQLDDDPAPMFDDGIVYDSMPIEYASDSIAYGGVSGAMGGAPVQTLSGGGGFGGGGFGRIALWGGLAVGITALATNNSGGNPPPVSNAMP